jgi:hypothetical protein
MSENKTPLGIGVSIDGHILPIPREHIAWSEDELRTVKMGDPVCYDGPSRGRLAPGNLLLKAEKAYYSKEEALNDLKQFPYHILQSDEANYND